MHWLSKPSPNTNLLQS